MKFKCTCGNVINATICPCKWVCRLYTQSQYIMWIKFICDIIPIEERPKLEASLFCEECKRYSFFNGEDLYVLKPSPVEASHSVDYEAYHLIDEFESEEIVVRYDDPQKINQLIESDFKSLPQTRMMNISFAEKTAYIENLDGSIETYVVEKVIKNT